MMRVVFIILTLVLISRESFSAPREASPDVSSTHQSSEEHPKLDQSPALDSMIITKPKETEFKKSFEEYKEDYFYKFQSSMSPRLGLTTNIMELEEDKNLDYLIGIAYQLASQSSRKWEIVADVFSYNQGHMQAIVKWLTDPTSRLRSYLKAGLGVFIIPSDELKNFLEINHYNIIIGVGTEYLVTEPMSPRLDIEIISTMEKVYGKLVIGYSWAW
jgi:hypothetical protein